MYKYTLALLSVIFVLLGCKTSAPILLPEQTIEIEDPNRIPERPIYNPSQTKKFDLIHTKLDVKFNWEKAYLYGKAELTLRPYFYTQHQLVLDSRGMNIQKIQLKLRKKEHILETKK